MLQKIYEKKTDEYVAAVRKDKEGMLPKILARVKESLKMIIDCRDSLEGSKWEETYKKCFYRSLDIKS